RAIGGEESPQALPEGQGRDRRSSGTVPNGNAISPLTRGGQEPGVRSEAVDPAQDPAHPPTFVQRATLVPGGDLPEPGLRSVRAPTGSPCAKCSKVICRRPRRAGCRRDTNWSFSAPTSPQICTRSSARHPAASEAQISSLSLRTNTQRFANTGTHQV